MESIPVTLDDGRTVSFEVETGLDGPAFFLLSIRKCGSSIFSGMGRALAEANGVNFIDLGDDFFSANVKERHWLSAPGLRDIVRPGNAYGGIRMLPVALLDTEPFQSSPKILLVRDLRDALVSEYFSNAYSHPIPQADDANAEVTELMVRLRDEARALDIDDVVKQRAGDMLRTALAYEAIIGSPSVTLLRYEDYIFDKGALMTVMAERFGWHIDDRLIGLILEWADVRPTEEDPTMFVRRVTPGDHVEKLQPETVEWLTEKLRPALDLFGYPASV